jgi:hypothetical protein
VRRIGGLLLLGVIAVAARIHGLGHTLHYDEAWVANSLTEPSVGKMLFYESWAQTTPLGYLLVARTMVMALGASNFSFEVLAFLFGLGGVAAVTWLGWREFSPARGLWMGLLAALSGPQVAFSKEAKQYSGEFLVAGLLLVYLVRCRASWGVPLALGAGFAFSPGVLTFLPAALIARRPSGRVVSVWIAGTAVTAGLMVALFYWPNRTPDLFQFWRPCFPNWDEPENVVRLLWRNVKVIFTSGFGFGTDAPAQHLARAGALVIAAAGVMRGRRTPYPVFALAPVGLAIGANLARQYPLCDPRFTAFLFPGVLLLHGLAWDFAVPRWVRDSILVVAFAGGLWLAWQPSLWPPRFNGGVESGVRYLSQHMDRRADVLFVHGVAQEEYKLYAKLQKFAPADAVIGQTGVGCCPRHLDWHRALNDDAFLIDEFERLLAKGTARRIWFLHIRQGAMGEIRQEEPIHRKMLAEKGCNRQESAEFKGTLISVYRCPL